MKTTVTLFMALALSAVTLTAHAGVAELRAERIAQTRAQIDSLQAQVDQIHSAMVNNATVASSEGAQLVVISYTTAKMLYSVVNSMKRGEDPNITVIRALAVGAKTFAASEAKLYGVTYGTLFGAQVYLNHRIALLNSQLNTLMDSAN